MNRVLPPYPDPRHWAKIQLQQSSVLPGNSIMWMRIPSCYYNDRAQYEQQFYNQWRNQDEFYNPSVAQETVYQETQEEFMSSGTQYHNNTTSSTTTTTTAGESLENHNQEHQRGHGTYSNATININDRLVDNNFNGEEEEVEDGDATTTLEANNYWVERFANTMKKMEKKNKTKKTKL